MAERPAKRLELCPGYFRGDLVIVQVDRRNTRLCQLSDTSDFNTSVLVGAVFWPNADQWRPCYIGPQRILRIADGERAAKARDSLARLKERQHARSAGAQTGAPARADAPQAEMLSLSELRRADTLSIELLRCRFFELLDLNSTIKHPALVVTEPVEGEGAQAGRFRDLADLYDRAQASRGDARRAVWR